MTGDLLVITPTRGRPGNAARLIDEVRKTARLNTHVHLAVDDDDPDLGAYRAMARGRGVKEITAEDAAPEGDTLETGPRRHLAAWTNEVAVRRAGEYRYLASLGDDHVPRTPGWDKALVRAIEDMGGTGIAYPHDGIRDDIPEAVVMSSDIVAALGWMCEPSLAHFYVDNVWADLGRGAGCLRYLRAVAVDHVHPGVGLAPPDATYREAVGNGSTDHAAYQQWRAGRMAADIETVKALRVQPRELG